MIGPCGGSVASLPAPSAVEAERDCEVAVGAGAVRMART